MKAAELSVSQEEGDFPERRVGSQVTFGQVEPHFIEQGLEGAAVLFESRY